MMFGVVAVAWTLALLPDLYRVFGEQGVAPQYPLLDYQWSVFEVWPGDRALLIGWVLLLLSAIAMIVGWHSRFAAILCVRTDPFVPSTRRPISSMPGTRSSPSSP